MKKSIPFISPVVFGLFGGVLLTCGLYVLSMMTSPFANGKEAPFLVCSAFVSVLSLIVIITMVVVNMGYLINLDNKHKTMVTLVAQACVGLLLLFLFWALWNSVFQALHRWFYDSYIW